jgi:hypothetical protein
MKLGNELLGDPKCWLCATVTKPSKIYGPNICFDCAPAYQERKFFFVRASQAEIDELFPTLRNIKLEKEENG